MSNEDKTILMICGLHEIRSMKFASYLSEFGWDVTVITSKNPSIANNKCLYETLKNVKLIKTLDIFPFLEFVAAGLKRLNLSRLIDFPDRHIGWLPITLITSYQIIRKNGIKIIYVSCSPYTGALIGTILKKLTGKPLVIDLRDPWTINEYVRYPTRVNKWINYKMEKWSLLSANYVTVVSDTMKNDYVKCYPWICDKIVVLPNGYDFEDLDINVVPFNNLTLSYVGSIYGNRLESVKIFFKALYKFISDKKIDNIKIFLIGVNKKEIYEYISMYNLREIVICMPMMPQKEAMKYIFKSHCLLLLEPSQSITTKVFEYLGSAKPILGIIKKGELESLIREYSDNSYIITDDNINSIEDSLSDIYKKWSENKIIKTADSKIEIFDSKYHRRHLSKKLEEILYKL